MSVDAMILSLPSKSQFDEQQQQRIPHLLQCEPLYEQEINLLAEVDIQEVSWHQHKHILAFISGPNQVTVQDFDDSDGKDPCIIISDSQRCIKALEWRPNGGKTLSVACKGGICIWSASYPGNAASVRSGVPSFVGTFSKGSGVRWTLVDFLRSPNEEQISSISWSPDGRYLASASYESSSFTIWDVAQGIGTPIRRGFGGISMLRWSPQGDYFFNAKLDGTFYLWETNTWTSELWSSAGGFITGATWDIDGSMILIAFSESLTLGSIHFASRPPSLDAHLLPVDFPELVLLTGSQGVDKIAWDASGERLALSCKGGNEMYNGLIAVYDVRRTPLISKSLIGFVKGPGESSKPLAFSFQNKFKQGPLLSVVEQIDVWELQLFVLNLGGLFCEGCDVGRPSTYFLPWLFPRNQVIEDVEGPSTSQPSQGSPPLHPDSKL